MRKSIVLVFDLAEEGAVDEEGLYSLARRINGIVAPWIGYEGFRIEWEPPFPSEGLPEGLHLEGSNVVDAQGHSWVSLNPAAPGDPTLWRHTIRERVLTALRIEVEP